MSKAEDRALERCPKSENVIEEMRNERRRAIFTEGYHQAEKDLELTWEDIRDIACLIDTVREEVDDDYLLALSIPKRIENEHREYKEILKRFKERKGESQ